MVDCTRTEQTFDRITYRLGESEMRHAILEWLSDRHNAGGFLASTTVEISDGVAVVTTDFERPAE